jgi:hypothetical protein
VSDLLTFIARCNDSTSGKRKAASGNSKWSIHLEFRPRRNLNNRTCRASRVGKLYSYAMVHLLLIEFMQGGYVYA